MPTFDAVLSRSAKDFLSSLELADRILFDIALDSLLEDPAPDGVSKVILDYFPYAPETIGTIIGEFWVVYKYLNVATIGVASIYWSPDSPARGGELQEA